MTIGDMKRELGMSAGKAIRLYAEVRKLGNEIQDSDLNLDFVEINSTGVGLMETEKEISSHTVALIVPITDTASQSVPSTATSTATATPASDSVTPAKKLRKKKGEAKLEKYISKNHVRPSAINFKLQPPTELPCSPRSQAVETIFFYLKDNGFIGLDKFLESGEIDGICGYFVGKYDELLEPDLTGYVSFLFCYLFFKNKFDY